MRLKWCTHFLLDYTRYLFVACLCVRSRWPPARVGSCHGPSLPPMSRHHSFTIVLNRVEWVTCLVGVRSGGIVYRRHCGYREGGEYATLDCGVRRVARSCCGIQPHHTLIWICVSVVRVCLLSDIALVYRDIVVVHYLIISVSRIDKYLPSPHFHNLYRH